VTFALRILTAAVAISASTGCGTSHDSILFAGDSSHRIRLLDAHTGQPISNLEVRLLSERVSGCSKAPCPIDSVTWTGRSDADGRIELPKSAIGAQATAATDSHEADLLDNATHEGGSEWVLELTAKDSSGDDPYPLKLLDEESRKPLASTPVSLKFTDTHNGEHEVALITNALGYVFIPSQIAAMGKHSFVKVKHYNVAFIDFGAQHNIYIRPIAAKFDFDH
jgi:hypothetical protein